MHQKAAPPEPTAQSTSDASQPPEAPTEFAEAPAIEVKYQPLRRGKARIIVRIGDLDFTDTTNVTDSKARRRFLKQVEARFPGVPIDDLELELARIGAEVAEHLLRQASSSKCSSGSAPSPSGLEDSTPVQGDEFHVYDGKLHLTVRDVESVLRRLDPPVVFQRERSLVHLVRLDETITAGGITRKAGSIVINTTEPLFVVKILTANARWLVETSKQDESGNKIFAHIDAPLKAVNTLLASPGDWNLPYLRGVIASPTLRPDGSVLSTPGYDETTGLYFEHGGLDFGRIIENPSRATAVDALMYLEATLSGFPFVAESDYSAAIAATLTGPVRRSLPSSPAFVIRARTRGTGKSLLADFIAMVATGSPCAVATQGHDENEDQKRFFSILLAGDQVASIDNVERPLESADLCAILTQQSYQGRLLGQSRMIKVPTNTLWLVTGNNVVVKGDLVSRVVPCDLDAKCEAPEQRKFDVELRPFVMENRAKLVRACLTILRAYITAGRPDVGLSVYGRFEAWSDMVRAPLVWLGRADPLANLERIRAQDPIDSAVRALISAWGDAFHAASVTVSDAIRFSSKHQRLSDAIELAVGKPNGAPDPQALGLFLSKHEGKILDGACFIRDGKTHGSARWRVSHGSGGSGGTSTNLNAGEQESDDGQEGGSEKRDQRKRECADSPQSPPESQHGNGNHPARKWGSV